MGSKALKGLLYIADDGTRYDLTDRAAGFPVLPEPDNAVLLALLGWAAEKLRVQINGVRPNPVPPESFPVGGRGGWIAPTSQTIRQMAEDVERLVEATRREGIRVDRIDTSGLTVTPDELPQRERTGPAPEPASEVPTEILEAALDGLTGGVTSPAGAGALERLRRQAAARERSKLEQGLAEAGRATEVVVPMEDEPRVSERPIRDAEVVEAPVLAADDGSEVGAEFDSREPLVPPKPKDELEQRTAQAFPDDEIPF